MDPEEVWKDVVGHEGTYEVSILGIRRVAGGRGARAGRILKPAIDEDGRPWVWLYLHGKRTKRYVSHLVANAFLPPKGPTDQMLRHLNDDPTDNRVENLAWGTYRDNTQDSILNGTKPTGSTHTNAKLTEDNVREIRRLYATGALSYRKLARQFGVSTMTISNIVRRKKWKHVT